VRSGDILYFHSAKDGEKVKILESNPYVSISFVGDINIPENYSEEELDDIVKDESKTALLISSVFTTEFESAIVRGEAIPIYDESEKIAAMKLICEKYKPDKMKYFSSAIKAGIGRTAVYKVAIEEITSKRKRYDSKGEEMKWGRSTL
jgi:nitroimidazol reductase NimA-like FMN-containing flavoprotein (pyridoxamine 5'-phosphate oxidase superfamily)